MSLLLHEGFGGCERQDTPADALIEKAVIDPLKHTPASPDLTDKIMQRLGYRRQPARQIKRTRVHRWLGRGTLACAAAVTIAVSMKIHDQMPSARVPEAITLPQAIEQDVRDRGRQFINFIEGVKQLAPPLPAPTDHTPAAEPADDVIEPGIDDSFTAPVRWV